MTRPFSFAVALLAVGLLVVIAQGNPLSQIKQAANQTRDAAEEKSEQVAEDAKHDQAQRAAVDGPIDESAIYHAIAMMTPTEGNSTRGWVRFDADKRGLTVTAKITGLTPNQKHGFHIHEFGDISDPHGKSTGGHYNPEGHDHALPQGHAQHRHAGDLGNLVADAQGNATFTQIFKNITISHPEHNPILGRGVIIHAKRDNGGQPTGNAGARIAQGVIGVANSK
ncbi:MAG: superoxide dismutase family protein [Planctomycetota bacterium]